MSIVFIGTPNFAVPSLRRLAAEGYEIATVITQPDRPAGRGRRPRPSPVKLTALELGLPLFQPPTLRDPDALAAVAAIAPEIIVAVAYGQILRQEFLDIPPRGVLNVHPSILPRYRGPSPIPAAILAGDDETGVSIILMDAGMDSGPILAQRRLRIELSDTTDSLSQKLAGVAAELLAETLPRWLKDEIAAQPQEAALATRCPLLRKEDGEIDWTRPALHIWRQVRAYNPWPGAQTHVDGQPLQIWQAWPLQGDSGSSPGTVVALRPEQRTQLPPDVGPEALAVQTGDGLLALLSLQRAGRKALSAGEFLRGMPGIVGRRLG